MSDKRRTLTQNAYRESLHTLACWLAFLDERERELEAQLARAKTRARNGSKATGDGTVLAWLDEEPPRQAAPAPESVIAGDVSHPSPAGEPDDGRDLPDWLAD